MTGSQALGAPVERAVQAWSLPYKLALYMTREGQWWIPWLQCQRVGLQGQWAELQRQWAELQGQWAGLGLTLGYTPGERLEIGG